MNKEQEELLSDAYWSYAIPLIRQFREDTKGLREWATIEGTGCCTKPKFINKIKTDNEFAKQCGVVYEERKLSEEERIEMIRPYGMDALIRKVREIWMEENNVPKLAISITYNNKTIESYEQRTKRVIK
jgi:hypothetical protein